MEEILLSLSVSINMKSLGQNSGDTKRKCQSAMFPVRSNELRGGLVDFISEAKSLSKQDVLTMRTYSSEVVQCSFP